MKSIDFIVNPISGGQSKARVLAAIGRHLDTSLYRYEIRNTAAAGEAERMARESQADVVVAVGGDGTVSEVARGVVGSSKVLGILPCGSGDGLALHLGISRMPEIAVQTLNKGAQVAVDAARMNGRYFFCTAGMGLDAAVSLDFARSTRRGLANYIALAWNDWREHPEEHYTIECGGESWSGDAVFVTVANANQWGNQARIAPMASLRDGLLDVVVVRPFSALEIPDLATRLMTGHADTSRRVLHFSGPRVQIRRARPGAVHYDGDSFEAGTEFDLSVEPGALQVLVPLSKVNHV